MTPRRKRQFLAIVILVVWSAVGFVLYWGWNDSNSEGQTAELRVSPQSVDTMVTVTGDASSEVSVHSFDGLWDRPLRRALYDPPPPPPPAPPPKKPPPRIEMKLLATMIEDTQKTAMLELQGSGVVFRKVGDPVAPGNESAAISDIQPGKVVVRQGEHETEYFVDGQGGR